MTSIYLADGVAHGEWFGAHGIFGIQLDLHSDIGRLAGDLFNNNKLLGHHYIQLYLGNGTRLPSSTSLFGGFGALGCGIRDVSL